MAFTFEYQHPLTAVFDKFIDPQFLYDRCIALGDIDVDCSVESDDDNVSITLNRRVRSDAPSVLQKILGTEQKLDIVEVWQRDASGWRGTSETDIVGTPLSISATMSLQPATQGCRFSMNYRCKAKVPLIGGKVEKAMAEKFEQELIRDHTYTADALVD
jgi:hypothetical protein